ncbi:MAG: transaldolase [Anaerolineae bacterium]|nr:transaldolase [Anaerolineae bacterium]
MQFTDLRIKIFADGANLQDILNLAQLPHIKGFTTNPTLMRKHGVTDYSAFAQQVLQHITDRAVSFEVFSDEFDEMERQARLIAGWGENVYVKIPVTNTRRESSAALIQKLAADGLKLNVTAIMTPAQVRKVSDALQAEVPSIVSVFAGRIADAGCDPLPIMIESLKILRDLPNAELLWASPREVFNVVQAEQIGCPIITMTSDLLAKLPNLGKDLEDYSLDTVKMFYNDAQASQFKL